MQTASGTPQGNTLRIGRVVKSYSEKHVVDVVFLDDGGFASGVAVSTLWGSQKHGFHYLPKVEDPPDGHWSTELSNKNDALALIGYFSGMPFVVGTVFPADKEADMNKLPLNTLLIKSYIGSYLEMDNGGGVTLTAIMGLGGEEGHGGASPTLFMHSPQDLATLFNTLCSVTMEKTGALTIKSGGGNEITMDPSGAIEMKSGGGAVINMSAGGIIELNPSSPSDPV